ncbi:MAG: citrate (Si)-synthase [Proteobacteria bacterium]|nr:citrate (Si)-synthase [Pseudomonadota bacterium]
MPDLADIKNTGLRGVTVASTKISDVKGDIGKLIYRGYRVTDLAENTSFEEVVFLLLYERMPTSKELVNFKRKVAESGSLPEGVVKALSSLPKESLSMDVLQAGISMLATYDKNVEKDDRAANEEMAVRLVARTSSLVAAWERIRNGRSPLNPKPDLSHAANFLYMISGEVPDKELEGFFDTCLVLHAEHSFNASTFTARQIASTRAHMYASVSGAVGSLSGELHGGANTRVMAMLKQINSLDAVDNYIETELNEGRKIMGLGHAVYKVDDPRALILAPMSKKMGERKGETKWYDMSKALEEKAKKAFKEKKHMDIFVNVDFYSASLYYSMGIPMDLFTPVFAVSRISGWCAHVLEEKFADAAHKPMLYRPKAEYVGEYCGPAECEFVDIDER